MTKKERQAQDYKNEQAALLLGESPTCPLCKSGMTLLLGYREFTRYSELWKCESDDTTIDIDFGNNRVKRRKA